MINIDATNFNNGGGFGVGSASEKSASINIAENKKGDKASGTSFEGVVVSGSGVDKKAMDQNTYNSLMDEADDVKAQIMQSATNAKMNLKNLFNRLNGADAVQINEDGFNLNDLSDEDCVNIVDRIKIELAAYNENYRAYAGDIDVDKIKEVVGSEGFAQQIAGQMETNGVPATDANITAVSTAVDKLSELGSGADNAGEGYSISMDAKLYMTANNSPATLDNVQIAESAYKAGQSGIDENQWNELKPQVENVIKRAGLEVNDANLSNAKALLDEDLPVTEDNLKYMASLDDIDFSAENVAKKTIEAIANGTEPEKAVLTEGKDLYGEVAKALGTLQKLESTNPKLSSEDENVEDPVSSIINIAQEISDDGIVSLHSLDEAYEKYVANPDAYAKNGENSQNSDGGQQAKDSTRVLYEIQILMTAEAGYNLEKNGLDINTVPITTLHENLLAYDKEIFMEELGDQLAHDIDSDEVYSTVYNTREALYDISHAPIDMVGALYKELAYSQSESPVTLMSASTSIKVRLSKASEAYETFESTVRSDLGDSVNRAVEASAGAMLNDMGYEDNRSNREAVSILVKNNMDVNEKNIASIKELKSTLDSIVENMKPETALNMIRNNINPYTADIREVNEYLKTENAKLENASGDKYSEFLYKLDRTDGITADERKQYIGIYKMMNMFTNDAGKAIGALVAQGADITMENLVTAYNSRKSYNKMDVSVDDSSDININVYENYYTNLFVATGDKITPNTLKNVNADKPVYERSVENFCEAADDFYDAAAEAAYMDDYMELARQIAAVDASVINELERGGEDITLNNIQAMEELMASDLFNNGFKIDKAKAQDIFDSLDDREKLNEKLSALSDEASEQLAAEIESDDNTYEVVKTSSISEMASQMMVRSARREDYTIPYVKADGIGMMKVSFKSDSGETGKISISYEDEALGNVCVNISVGENDISMSAVYETKRALRGVADQQETDAADAFKKKLENAAGSVSDKFNFKSADVIINPVRSVSRNIYNSENSSVSSATLYKIAKTVVEGLV
jgi:hypothetical protein